MIESALAFHDDSCRFFSFRCDSVDEGLCHEGEVFSAEDGFKKSLGGGLSSAVVDCSFCGRESFLLVGVVVREGWVSCLSSGFEERCIERIFVLRAGDAEFSFSAAPVLCGCVVLRSGFDFLEVREDMGAVPSFSAEFFPCIEVFGVSSDEDHAVDGGGREDFPCAHASFQDERLESLAFAKRFPLRKFARR